MKQDDAIWSILTDAKGRGTEKPQDMPELSRGRHKTSGKGKAKETQMPSRYRVTALDPLPDDRDDSISQAGVSLFSSQSGHGRSLRKRPSTSGDMESISMNGHSYPGSARKKRRLSGDDDVPSMPPPPTIPNGRSSKRSRDNSHHLSVSADPRTRSAMNGHSSTGTRVFRPTKQQSVSYAGHTSSASPIKSGIKRVKLIVRAPPPLISHPRQRPPVPRFESLDKFLSSYTTYNDQDLTEEVLEERAKADSIILDRIDDFRRQGRLLPDLDSESGSGLMSTATGTTHKRGPDIWDQVVDEVVASARVKRNGNGIGGRGRQIASQVASRVLGYWDGHALREDKAKAQEERRLRALAKATIKMVTGEWKKAVFVRFLLISTQYTVVLICSCFTPSIYENKRGCV